MTVVVKAVNGSRQRPKLSMGPEPIFLSTCIPSVPMAEAAPVTAKIAASLLRAAQHGQTSIRLALAADRRTVGRVVVAGRASVSVLDSVVVSRAWCSTECLTMIGCG